MMRSPRYHSTEILVNMICINSEESLDAKKTWQLSMVYATSTWRGSQIDGGHLRMLTKGTMMMDCVFLVQTQMPTGGIYKLHGATGSMTANDPDHKHVWTKKYCRGTAGRYATTICKHFRPQWHSRLGLKVSGCTPPMGSHNPNPHRLVAMQKVVVP